jgi:hypothetical protein
MAAARFAWLLVASRAVHCLPHLGPPSGLSPAQLEIWGPKDFSAKEAPAPPRWVLEDVGREIHWV